MAKKHNKGERNDVLPLCFIFAKKDSLLNTNLRKDEPSAADDESIVGNHFVNHFLSEGEAILLSIICH